MEGQDAVNWINDKKEQIRQLQRAVGASNAEMASISNQLGFNTAFIQEYYAKIKKVCALNAHLERQLRLHDQCVEYFRTQITFSEAKHKPGFEPTNPDVFLQTILEYRASTVRALRDIAQIRALVGYPFNPGFDFAGTPFSQSLLGEEWLQQDSCVELLQMFGLELSESDIAEIYERSFFEQSAAAHLLLDDRIRFVRAFWMRALRLYTTYTQEAFYNMPVYTYDDFLRMLRYERENMKKQRTFIANCKNFHVEPLKVPFTAEQPTCEFQKPLPRANRDFLRQTQELADELTLRVQVVQGKTVPDLRVFKPRLDAVEAQMLSQSWNEQGFANSTFKKTSYTESPQWDTE